MSKYNKTTVAAAFVAAAMFASPAIAVPPVITDLDNCAVTDTDPSADACDGYFDNLNTSGNADNMTFLNNVLSQWGLSSDGEIKDDNNGSGSTNLLFDAFAGGGGGTIDFLQALAGPFAIAIKAGNYLGLYFFDDGRSFGADDLLTFSIPDMDGGEGLSHVSIFGGEPTTTVPEPGTLALLGLGLAGLGLRRRLKK